MKSTRTAGGGGAGNTTGGGFPQGESHRIYWQQWLVPESGIASPPSSTTGKTGGTAIAAAGGDGASGGAVGATSQQQQQYDDEERSRRGLITSSAAVRISPTGARARDVTDLLRRSLQISSPSTSSGENDSGAAESGDRLVLVGTLFSLPKDYVRYEHEEEQLQRSLRTTTGTAMDAKQLVTVHLPGPRSSSGGGNNDKTASVAAVASPYPHRSDPFHVVRTLSPADNPLTERDAMMRHLQVLQQRAAGKQQNSPATPATTLRAIISPKLQWYYVPAISGTDMTSCCIPNCIELDGYCTSTTDEEEESDEDESSDSECHGDVDDDRDQRDICGRPATAADPEGRLQHGLRRRFPWLSSAPWTAVQQLPNSSLTADARLVKRVRDEDRRYRRLAQSLGQSAEGNTDCLSGFLLKRSGTDPHVWRRVHCMLTEEYLWFVSRLYDANFVRGGGDPDSTYDTETISYAKHGRIRLTRALLLEPTPDNLPLYRTPYAFEVVSANGKSHLFRAKTKHLQRRWMRSISDRIIQSHENSLLEHAELIVADENMARSQRVVATAASSLWDECMKRGTATRRKDGANDRTRPFVGVVLRFGLDIAGYRENCRYVHSMLPARNPVVVMSANANRRYSDDARAAAAAAATAGDTVPVAAEAEPIDRYLQDMISDCWDQAAALLVRATHVALTIQPDDSNSNNNKKMSNSLETLCRHVDYVITGRFRPLKENGDFASMSLHEQQQEDDNSNDPAARNHHRPPPVDLFDHLLEELQIHAAAAAASAETSSAPTNTATASELRKQEKTPGEDAPRV